MRGRPVTGKDNKQLISITVDPDLLELIKKRADEDDRSLSQYINRFLKQQFEKLREEEN